MTEFEVLINTRCDLDLVIYNPFDTQELCENITADIIGDQCDNITH